ncbi:hypothetical protein I4641_21415 [Waterburya agarophytonicola K14]|uniref:Uncharacterized protein n=1 Tax=Waterburya agarophytonicola KI4 TaxID=2874699 RepID=A0A964BXS1_9CYAN|nr:hypothetical protein [Waterburya agarophytonicola]MCC0179522.1 hypothetical protein [Waterburya agarophytonicola KI4]
MAKYKNFFVNLVTNLTIVIALSLWIAFPALAVTQKLQFNTPAGYTVKTTFSYDETQKPKMIRERGNGKTEVLDSLKISFYNPSGELMANYNNVVEGIATGTYFEFNFDPATQQILGKIDLGGESAGQMYLKGEAEGELSLIEVTQSGSEKVIDRVSIESSK